VDATGAIDRLEIEAGGLTFTGRACGPRAGRRVLLLHADHGGLVYGDAAEMPR